MPGTGSCTYLIQKVFWRSASLVIFFFCSVASTWSKIVTDLHQSLRLLDNPAGQSRHRERRGGKERRGWSGFCHQGLKSAHSSQELVLKLAPPWCSGHDSCQRLEKLGWTVLQSPRRGSELLPAPAPRHQSSLRLFKQNYKFKFKVFAVEEWRYKRAKRQSCQRWMQAWTLKKHNLILEKGTNSILDPLIAFFKETVLALRLGQQDHLRMNVATDQTIILWRKTMPFGEIWSFYKEFVQFMEFYQSLCHFCSKSMWRKIFAE